MKEEVNSATGFLAGLIASKVPGHFLECFKSIVSGFMTKRYQDHWHPKYPHRGSAYRSITVHYNRIDPLVFASLVAAYIKAFNLSEDRTEDMKKAEARAQEIGKYFPQELALWVDPMDVSYRIGDNGSIGVVYSGQSTPITSDSESDTSMTSSAQSSPCSSPVGSPPHPSALGYQPSAHPGSYLQCRQQAFQPQQQYHQYPYNGLQMVYTS